MSERNLCEDCAVEACEDLSSPMVSLIALGALAASITMNKGENPTGTCVGCGKLRPLVAAVEYEQRDKEKLN